MKLNFLIFTTIFLFTSCKKTNFFDRIYLNAKIVSQVTQKGISGAKVHIEVISKHGSGITSYETLIDSLTVTSDDNGNLPYYIKINRDSNIIVKFYKEDDLHSSIFFDLKNEYALSELKNSPPPTFYVRKYANLQIDVRSINSQNDNDAVSVSIFQNNTNYQNKIVDSIRNFGVRNVPYSYLAEDDGRNPYWIGKNVNSIIYGRIQEGTTYQIIWNVRRNGMNTNYNSETLNTTTDSLNSYSILY